VSAQRALQVARGCHATESAAEYDDTHAVVLPVQMSVASTPSIAFVLAIDSFASRTMLDNARMASIVSGMTIADCPPCTRRTPRRPDSEHVGPERDLVEGLSYGHPRSAISSLTALSPSSPSPIRMSAIRDERRNASRTSS
jgi:hypothetical protein